MGSLMRSLSQRSVNFVNVQYSHRRLVNVVDEDEGTITFRNVGRKDRNWVRVKWKRFVDRFQEISYAYVNYQSKEARLFVMIFALIVIWNVAAFILFFFENTPDLLNKKHQAEKIESTVLEMISSLKQIHSYHQTDNGQWDQAVLNLLQERIELMKPMKVNYFDYYVSWHSKMIGHTGKLSNYTLSFNSQIMILIFSPLGIFLYYYNLWHLATLIHRHLPFYLNLLIASFFIYSTFIYIVTSCWNSTFSFDIIYTHFMLLSNTNYVRTENMAVTFALHAIFWTSFFVFIKHLHQKHQIK